MRFPRSLLNRPRSGADLAWAVLPAAFVILIVLFFPFRYRIEFDTDEGINAIKAMMVLRGYRLYSEIWSDQPPFFTYLLAAWFRVFGPRLNAGRILVLLFSAGMIALGTNVLRRNWGRLAAVCGGVTLFLLPFFPRLSVSMMIGLPAIALAIASLYALMEWHARPRWGPLLASSVLLGLSILTKGLTVILVPIWFAGIALAAPRSAPSSRRWLVPLAWIGTLGLMGAVSAGLIVGPENLGQLFDVHLRSAQTDAFQLSPTYPTLGSFLVESWPIFLLAAVGSLGAVRGRKWAGFYLAGWVVVGTLVLASNRPTWYHHQLFLTIPAALLSAIAVAAAIEAVRGLPRVRPRPIEAALHLASLVLILIFLVGRVPGTLDGLDPRFPNFTGPQPGEEAERQLLAAIYRYRDQTNWMFTDRPIFAFIAGIPVPPRLAVISQKRLLTGNLTEGEIGESLKAYSPEMILNARFDLPVVEAYMRPRNFQRIDQTLKYRLYFRPPPQLP